MLSANSNHVEEDLLEACRVSEELGREQVVLACLAGSFNHDPISNTAYVLCEKQPNLAFFSGFHRHGALRNPFDSFTANFCHPNALIACWGLSCWISFPRIFRWRRGPQRGRSIHQGRQEHVIGLCRLRLRLSPGEPRGAADTPDPAAGSVPGSGRHRLHGTP
ncbi:MAG: hypothetical protein CM15mP77_0370 [Synechococcus sp.]|nr:MAG: hypothetical protein CM15mP77_0370 [Synechococcus sp.]